MTLACVDQLPDDLVALKRLVIEHQAALVGRQLQLEQAQREVAARDAQIEQIKREAAEQIEAMKQRHQAEMGALLRRFYGPRNERFDLTQLLLFGQEIDRMPLDVRAVEQEAGQKLLTRRARNRHNHGRAGVPGHLPREVVKHDLKEAEKFDANGKPLVYIGYEVSEQLGYRRGGLFVLEHRRFKYAPADYQQSDTGATIVIADKPPQPIEKGLAAPCLLAHVITSKLADHLPLYRLERIFARQGVHVAQSTMCGWVLACAELVAPLVLLMKSRVKQSKSIHSDETRVPVQSGSKGKCRSGRMWDWIGDAANAYTVFEYTPDRTNVWPLAWVQGYEGYLQADAGSSYDAVYRQGKIIEVGCSAHARRKFFVAKDTDSIRSAQMLGMVRRLYKVEDDADKAIAEMEAATTATLATTSAAATSQSVTREQADEVRRHLRQRDSVPVLKQIKAWLDEQAKLVLPHSPMAEAIGYALNQWDALCIYAEYGFLDIDNNVAERAFKLIALGRKNWLFVHSDKFGKAYATLYSLIASAQQHGLDPEAYLRCVLAQIMSTPISELGQFLPDVYKSRLAAEAAPGSVPANASGNVPSPGP